MDEAELKTPFVDLLPPLATDEFEALKASIEREGIRDPILVDDDSNILDGHHRHRIRPDAPTRVIAGLTEGQKRAFVLASNFQRRNLSPEQKSDLRKQQIEIARALKDEVETQAQIAVRLGVAQNTVSGWLMPNIKSDKAHKPDNRVKVTKEDQTAIFDRVDAGERQEQVAADFGISQSRVSRVTKAEKKKRDNEALKEKAPPPVEALYDVIVIDPPWPVQKIERDVRPNQVQSLDYPTMTIDELTEFPVAKMAAEKCHLFLWATQRFLPDALGLAEHWGFRYICLFTWHKPGGFQPVGLPQYNSEFVVYARQGSPEFTDTKAFFTCFDAPRREHSRKPDEFYSTVARVTAGRRIEVFAREPRDGFDVWGNESAKFAGAAT